MTSAASVTVVLYVKNDLSTYKFAACEYFSDRTRRQLVRRHQRQKRLHLFLAKYPMAPRGLAELRGTRSRRKASEVRRHCEFATVRSLGSNDLVARTHRIVQTRSGARRAARGFRKYIDPTGEHTTWRTLHD